MTALAATARGAAIVGAAPALVKHATSRSAVRGSVVHSAVNDPNGVPASGHSWPSSVSVTVMLEEPALPGVGRTLLVHRAHTLLGGAGTVIGGPLQVSPSAQGSCSGRLARYERYRSGVVSVKVRHAPGRRVAERDALPVSDPSRGAGVVGGSVNGRIDACTAAPPP